MKWKEPPIIKIYEALGAVADNRVEVIDNIAKVYSSSRNKYYDVIYDPAKNAIMSNDNGSYWQGYLGYPSIAFLMEKGIISYQSDVGNLLKNIAWKDINQKFNNDFERTLDFILLDKSDDDKKILVDCVKKVEDEINGLQLNILGKKVLPPKGY
jgi:hypothetical protein